MKILVTGACGFVGTHLTRRLRADGHEVRTLARPSSDASRLEPLGVDVVRGDLRDYDAVRRAVEGCELIYHLARVRPETRPTLRTYQEVNVGGTQNVMRAAADRGVEHVVHGSTAQVFGRPRTTPVDERTPPRPTTFHDKTKLESEQVVTEHAMNGGPSALIVRLVTVWGPYHMRPLGFVRSVLKGRFVMYGSGEIHHNIAYVDDIVEGLVRCGARREAAAELYVLAGGENPTLRELVAAIAAAADIDVRIVHLPLGPIAAGIETYDAFATRFGIESRWTKGLEFFSRDRSCSIGKARRDLGYAPRFGAHETVSKTVGWYREQGHL